MPAILNKKMKNSATYKKAPISKTKTLSADFYSISRIYIKFTKLLKKKLNLVP